MEDMWSSTRATVNRRSFMKNGLSAAGLATTGLGLLANSETASADIVGWRRGRLTRGDAALLRFAAAAEILETDFWVQYNELCRSCRTTKCPVEVETPDSPTHFRNLIATWLSMCTTIPMTNLLTRISKCLPGIKGS